MDNRITQELSESRYRRLAELSKPQITILVKNAITFLAPGAMEGLQGLSAEHNGVTYALWAQALQAAELQGCLVFPHYNDSHGVPADAKPCTYEQAAEVVAGRTARAILVTNGLQYDVVGDDFYCL